MIMISMVNEELCPNRLRKYVTRHVDQDMFLPYKSIELSELNLNRIT